MDRIEQRILEVIDLNRERIIEFGWDIHTHAELGYREFRTAGKFAAVLKELGMHVEEGIGITGVKGYLGNKDSPGKKLCLLGELDGLVVPKHKYADPKTGAAHCCGHDAQLTGVMGAALALADSEVRESIGDDIIFAGVPAEEVLDKKFCNQLMDEGKIRYMGGKCEWIRLGAFDDVDMCVYQHTRREGPDLSLGSWTNSGFVSKTVTYHGTAAHAASAPHAGVNALYCANIAMTAMNALRETYRDEDAVRVHAIITKGGDAVNVIPDHVEIDCLVRAKTMEAVRLTEKKIDRAFAAGAIGMGAGATIRTLPGYLPKIPFVDDFLEEVAAIAAPNYKVTRIPATAHGGASTDVGDLTHLMPIVQFGTNGVEGLNHSPTFNIVNKDIYYVLTAKMFALTAYRLMKDNAALRNKIVREFRPKLTKDAYLEYMESTMRTEEIARPE